MTDCHCVNTVNYFAFHLRILSAILLEEEEKKIHTKKIPNQNWISRNSWTVCCIAESEKL